MTDPSELTPFTRSKCAGGQYCSATCEIHKRKRRRVRTPLTEFSDDDLDLSEETSREESANIESELPATPTLPKRNRTRKPNALPPVNHQSMNHSYYLIYSALLALSYVLIFYIYWMITKQAPYQKQLQSVSHTQLASLEPRPLPIVSTTPPDQCLTVDQVNRIIDTYDADKTGLADYALESGGATIVSTRCSQNYAENNVKFSLNGIVPLLYTSNTPRLVISPSIYPGECWSFAGSHGHLVIKLSRTILPTIFTYEHIRKQLSPDLSISSAPKNFRVKSLKDASDIEGLTLGEYSFDDQGQPLQQFLVQNPNPIPTRYIQLDILSNHGEMQYTCLYRFRVHGKLIASPEN